MVRTVVRTTIFLLAVGLAVRTRARTVLTSRVLRGVGAAGVVVAFVGAPPLQTARTCFRRGTIRIVFRECGGRAEREQRYGKGEHKRT